MGDDYMNYQSSLYGFDVIKKVKVKHEDGTIEAEERIHY